MEEILASIRRIIADDQDSVKTPNPSRPPVALVSEFGDGDAEDDVLDLADIAPPPLKPPPAVKLDIDLPEVDFREVGGDPAGWKAIGAGKEPEPERHRPQKPEPSPVLRRAEPPAASNEDHLISKATDATVGQAFNLLASTVLGNNTGRWKISCGICCGRCSRIGWTTTCPRSSSVWCAPKSSGSRAGSDSAVVPGSAAQHRVDRCND
jgi:cell pole-organizing protein PopZ